MHPSSNEKSSLKQFLFLIRCSVLCTITFGGVLYAAGVALLRPTIVVVAEAAGSSTIASQALRLKRYIAPNTVSSILECAMCVFAELFVR